MRWHRQDGARLPVAVWYPGPDWRMISSSVAGGGIGPREWVINAQVPASYSRMDPAVHLAELAAGFGRRPSAGASSSRSTRPGSCSRPSGGNLRAAVAGDLTGRDGLSN